MTFWKNITLSGSSILAALSGGVISSTELFKAIGKAKLTWKELESVLFDIEITLNSYTNPHTNFDDSWTTKFWARSGFRQHS